MSSMTVMRMKQLSTSSVPFQTIEALVYNMFQDNDGFTAY